MSEEQSGVSLNFNTEPPKEPLSQGDNQPQATAEFDLNITPPAPPVAEPTANTVVLEAPVQSLQPQNTVLYSSDDPANNQVDLTQAGFDLNIEQKVPAAEAELGSQTGDVVDSIVSQATVNKEQEDKILKELEQMDASLELDVPVAPLAEGKVKTAKMIFFGVLLTSIAVLAYLFFSPSNGTASLGQSALDPLSEQKQQLLDTQSELIASHYFVANSALKSAAENTAKLAVNFDISQSNFSDYNQKADAERSLDDYRDNIESALKIAEKEISEAKKLMLENEAVSANLLLYLSSKESKSANPVEKAQYRESLGVYRNNELLAQIKNLNFAAENEELLNQLEPIMASLGSSDMGRLAHVQTKRISWSHIISELERITEEVDPGMNSITYNGYTFDADQNRVSVTGQIQTADEKTFTTITLLVDSLNQPDSPFENASNTSFSKNASEENGFTSSIRLDFNLK